MLFKEAVHNIVRHSGCTEAEIVFRVELGLLRLRVWDNGNGLNPETADRGQGLRSMRQHAERLGGQIHVTSSREHGTSIDLMDPCRASCDARSRTSMQGRFQNSVISFDSETC
jgi:signal transduction histidine kinase